MQVAENPALNDTTTDPTLICTGYKKNRFYLFSRVEADQDNRFVVKCNILEIYTRYFLTIKGRLNFTNYLHRFELRDNLSCTYKPYLHLCSSVEFDL